VAAIDIAVDPAIDPGPAASAPGQRRRLRLGRSKKILVGLVLLGILVVVAIIGPINAPHDTTGLAPLQGPPLPGSSVPSQRPGGLHWLGQTTIGGDIFSQLLAGTRPTVIVAFLAGALATVLAVVIGIAAGYLGGLVDEVLSMLANIFLVIPALPLLIAIGAFLGPDRTGNPVVVSVIIALTGWAWGARVLRAQALSIRSRDFVEAARISGESAWRIILAEILPNLTAVIASSFLFTTIYAIGTYVGLGFLTVVSAGADYNWGTMLFDATSSSAVQSGFWWWYIPPGIAIALLGTSLALINFGVDEYINPRLRAVTGTRQARTAFGVKLRPQLGFTPVVRIESARAGRRRIVIPAVAATPAAPSKSGTGSDV
jgi:peptide/nickel transport system permease protein